MLLNGILTTTQKSGTRACYRYFGAEGENNNSLTKDQEKMR
jgi:hypothetical protein